MLTKKNPVNTTLYPTEIMLKTEKGMLSSQNK
jgi:hypothetical protein